MKVSLVCDKKLLVNLKPANLNDTKKQCDRKEENIYIHVDREAKRDKLATRTCVSDFRLHAERRRFHGRSQLQRFLDGVLVCQVSEHAASYRVHVVPTHILVDEQDEGMIPRRIVGDHQLEGVRLRTRR